MKEAPSADGFDPDALRLPPGAIGDTTRPVRPPRHRPGEAFLKGPIPWSWMATACRLPGAALAVASAVRYRAGRTRPDAISLGLADLSGSLGVLPRSARRGLAALEGAGLVAVVRRSGCKPLVTIRDLPEPEAGRRPLRGPIPWDWWTAASRLPGKSLQVAAALWFLVGWSGGRQAEFEFGLSDWSELGLSRFSAARGLEALAGAGLVEVEQRAGQKPLVLVRSRR
jgi:hypothetical protein